jgi:hypothetical protein
MLGQLGVFDRAQANRSRDLFHILRINRRVLFRDDGPGTFDGFVKKLGKADGLTRARAHDLSIIPKDASEGDVLEV